MYHVGLQALRAKIRGLYAAGSTISHRISRTQRDRRHRLWVLKRQLGDVCRHHLIAYAILRGVPYNKVEKCANHNRPDAQELLRLVQEHVEPHQRNSQTIEQVQAYLTVRSEVTSRAVVSSVDSIGGVRFSAKATAHTMAQEKFA